MGTGIFFNAFSAEDASLILSSLTLITKISCSIGKYSVLPSPAKLVSPIPIEDVIPPFLSYLTFSPETKK